MKIIDKSFILKNNKESMINNEKWIMSNLDSQFLTRLHCSFETKYYLVFVMEYLLYLYNVVIVMEVNYSFIFEKWVHWMKKLQNNILDNYV